MVFGKYSLLLVFSLSSLLNAWCNPEIETGKKLYIQHCAECHGEKGEGVEESEVKVGDISLHVLDALEAGES